jgi:hypothetical protein
MLWPDLWLVTLSSHFDWLASLVFSIGSGVITFASEQLGVMLFEAVGNVFEEDRPEDDVLVLRRIHVAAQLVGSEPELGLEADVGGGVTLRRFRTRTGHESGETLTETFFDEKRVFQRRKE